MADAPSRVAGKRGGPWWTTRTFAWCAILVAAIPLLWPAIPPLVDLPGHIGRYHVALDLSRSADLQRYWTYRWRPIGNLGVDLLMMPLGRLLGVEAAAKLIVVVIPPLFVAGLIRASRAATGTLSPAAAFAFPLAYGFPFQLGFVNFMLAAALALHALAAWIELGHRGHLVRRTVLFVPISIALWLAHSFGWGLFGLFAFVADAVRRRSAGWRGLGSAAGLCLPLALPALVMLAAPAGGDTTIDYGWIAKASWVASLLRERWEVYDVGCVAMLAMVLWTALRRRDAFAIDPLLGTLALAGGVVFLALPRLMLGGSYVDMRMLGIAVAIALLAIRVRPVAAHLAPWLAIAANGFFAMRLVTSTAAMALFAHGQQEALAAIPHIPRGAAVLTLIDEPCSTRWSSDRLTHLDGLALARRDAFVNGQWALPGQQLIGLRGPEPAYRTDPSQLVYPATCDYITTDFAAAVRDFDRHLFSYVWTMGFEPRSRLARDVTLVWHNRTSALYRVDPGPATP